MLFLFILYYLIFASFALSFCLFPNRKLMYASPFCVQMVFMTIKSLPSDRLIGGSCVRMKYPACTNRCFGSFLLTKNTPCSRSFLKSVFLPNGSLRIFAACPISTHPLSIERYIGKVSFWLQLLDFVVLHRNLFFRLRKLLLC